MRTLGGCALAAIFVSGALVVGAPAAETPLDYQVFKARVEPLFLKHRAGHARCYTCHAESNNSFRLERLAPGAAFWSEDQSRRNFETVSALVVPGDPASSKLLLHPLAPEAGGESYHSGGRQFGSKSDPDWRALAAWVNGRKN